jgi:hypothetical protein
MVGDTRDARDLHFTPHSSVNGHTFYRCLERIVGEESAARYARRFGPLDNSHSGGTVLNYEALAVYAYSTELTWHERINSELWSGNPTADVVLFTDVLNGTLAKLPPYLLNSRVVYRGFKADNLDTFLRRYRLGHQVTFPAFTSASFKQELAFGGNVLFTIRTLTGKAIWYLTANFDELEVLIPSGRSFRVVDVDRHPDAAVINLDELR